MFTKITQLDNTIREGRWNLFFDMINLSKPVVIFVFLSFRPTYKFLNKIGQSKVKHPEPNCLLFLYLTKRLQSVYSVWTFF